MPGIVGINDDHLDSRWSELGDKQKNRLREMYGSDARSTFREARQAHLGGSQQPTTPSTPSPGPGETSPSPFGDDPRAGMRPTPTPSPSNPPVVNPPVENPPPPQPGGGSNTPPAESTEGAGDESAREYQNQRDHEIRMAEQARAHEVSMANQAWERTQAANDANRAHDLTLQQQAQAHDAELSRFQARQAARASAQAYVAEQMSDRKFDPSDDHTNFAETMIQNGFARQGSSGTGNFLGARYDFSS